MFKLKKTCDKVSKKIKLIIIWFFNILLAKSHFKVSVVKRLYYAIFGGFMVDQIVLYNLNRKNKKEYLSEFDWYKSRYINGTYNFILNNKVVCSDFFKNDLNVPKTYCIKQNKEIYSDNKINSYNDIISLLKNKKILIVKPISKGKGNDVLKIEFNKKQFKVNGTNKTKEELISILEKNNDWFISDYVKQAKYLDDIFEYTSNTIRLITVKDPKTTKCKVLFAVQRIGTNKSIPVDNGSQGGLVSKIDLETGILSEAKTIHSMEIYNKHPDSNSLIKGIKIPNWNEIKDKYVKTMEKYPYFNFVAWDILMTDDGPFLIEANTSSGVNIIQIWGAQRNKELGEFYKQHNVIKK